MDSKWGLRITDCGFRTTLLSLVVVLLIPVLAVPAGGAEPGAEARPILAIVPFIVEKVEDPGRGAVCPVCGGIHRSSEVPAGVPHVQTLVLYAKVEALGVFNIFPIEKVEEALFKKGGGQSSGISSLVEMGKELNANYVMVSILFRFEERVGSSLGVDKPASVAFDLHLYRLRDGKKVWDGDFDETQKPLFDDLLRTGSFLRRKAKWLTAADLAEVGMEETLRKLPSVKELEEKR